MSVYRTKTYIAAVFDHDKDAVDQLYKWNDSKKWSLNFLDAHELQTSRDNSLYCSIKNSLKKRMDYSRIFVLIVGNKTNNITKGGCQYCDSYKSSKLSCDRGKSVDNRSYIRYECEKAVEADIKIIVLYNDIKVDKSKCPEAVREIGTHKAMISNKDYDWDYQSVKEAFDI